MSIVQPDASPTPQPNPESLLAAIVESSHDAIIGQDLRGFILSWNPAAERMFGYSPGEAIGQHIAMITPEHRRDESAQLLEKVARGEPVENFETERQTSDGRLVHVSLMVSPICDSSGAIIGSSKFVRDITADRRAQEELGQKARHLMALYNAGKLLGATLEPEAIFQTLRSIVTGFMDCDSLLISSYDAEQSLIRAAYAWIEGNTTDVAAFPAIPLAPEGKGLQSQVIRSGEPLLVNDVEQKLRDSKTNYRVNSDGSIDKTADPDKPQTRSMLLVPMKLEGEIIGVVQVLSNRPGAFSPSELELLEGVVYQLSAAVENARLYLRVKEEGRRLREMADAMPQIVWSLDAEGKVDFLNKRYSEYSGLDVGNSPAQAWAEVVHPDDMSAASEKYRQKVDAGEVWEQELRLRDKAGNYRWHLSRLVPLRKGDRIVRWYGTSTDIHEKKQAEEQITELNAKLESRVQQRTQELQAANTELEGFTYSVSHDLRTPLRSIVSSSRILLEDYGQLLPDEAKAYLEKQALAAKKLASLIDDLLQYSRLARHEVTRSRVDLSELASGIAEDLHRRQPEREVDWLIEPGLVAAADPDLTAMLLSNLLENAFKFTRDSRPARIRFARDGEAFFVEDNGIGFQAEYAHKLFRPFERLHRDSDYPGTGIGLANVKRISERHGGRVWVQGAPNQGATFYFTLRPGGS